MTRWLLIFGGVSLLLLSPAQAVGEEILKWKFAAGEVLNYITHCKTVNEVHAADDPASIITSEVTAAIQFTVEAVEPNGKAQLAMRFQRVKVRQEGTKFPMADINWDSEQKSDGRLNQDQEKVLRTLLNDKITIVMNSSGDVFDIAVQDAATRPANSESPIEKTMKSTARQWALCLSAEPVGIGDTWTSTLKEELGFFITERNSRFRLEGSDRGIANIAAIHRIHVSQPEDPKVHMSIDKVDKAVGTDRIKFDIKRGKLTELSADAEIEMEFTVAETRFFKSKIKSSTRISLTK